MPRSCLPFLLAMAAPLAVAACGPRAEVATGAHGTFGEARRLLVLQAADGPVPLDVDAVPVALAGGESELVRLAEEAVGWSNARFVAAPGGGEGAHLALRFAAVPASPGAACAGSSDGTPASPTGPVRLHAIFCDGPTPVADAIGTAARSGKAGVADLLDATLGRLFPGGRGGYGGLYPGVSLGVGIGSGGSSGVGVGVGF
ncbi:hypothetical protein SH611_03715 [Geminicoccaceae bacterium 1502E]|nr:hypothetical protein [Geminicoccaceae bacterium 1502E]